MTESTDLIEQTNKTLKNLNPEEFATALFQPFAERAVVCINALPDVGSYDITTKEGLAIAKAHLNAFKTLRIESDKERKTYKEPINKTAKALDGCHKTFLEGIAEYEARFANEVAAEKIRQEDIKAAKIRAIAEREAQVQANMDHIVQSPLNAISMKLQAAQDLYAELEVMVPTKDDFDNRDVEAEAALKETLPKLKEVIDGRIAQEKMAAEAEATRKESERKASIQAKINNLNSYLSKAVAERTSSGVQLLITELNNVDITEAEYAELKADAETAKANVLMSLENQLNLLTASEQAKAIQEDTTKIPDGDGIKPAIQAVANSPAHINANYQEAGNEVITPQRNEMVSVIAEHFTVHPEVAEQWLLDTFGVKAA